MKFFHSVFIAMVGFAVSLEAQPNSSVDLTKSLPVDANIEVGRLENGLKYYIRKNQKPENRVELRLVVNAGSIQENDNQRGLAHFVEHMAFNGTVNFEKQEIIDYLELIGMRFGPDINAYTSFDETVYILQLPSEDEILAKGFQILEEWAHNVAFKEEDIDKERGVVIEEWRLGRGAGARMRDAQFPVLFDNSRYAERLPIGSKEILENASYETIRQFYHEWYRPNLMAVIAVGDFAPERIRSLITEHFGKLENPGKGRERKLYPVPDHEETLFGLVSDTEATATRLEVFYKHPVKDETTVGGYRDLLVSSLYNMMFNNRLQELLQNPEPPFIVAFSGEDRIIRSKEFYYLAALAKENEVESALDALLTEAARVRQHGFTDTELAREKETMLRGIEQAFKERDKTESSDYAEEYIRNFLTDEPIPGVELEFEMQKALLPGIQLADVNKLANEWIRDKSRVVLVSAPQKDASALPTKGDLSAILSKVASMDIEPYADSVSDEPLISTPPSPGPIVKETKFPEVGVTQWELANGVKVVLKPTDFKNDEILMTAFSPGGNSLVDDENYIPAVTAISAVTEGGLGQFDQIALGKKLAGKIVSVSPSLGTLEEGFNGHASPADLETLFELTYLYFIAPRQDSTAFLSFRNRYKNYFRNRHASPQAAFYDTLQVTMANYHPRSRPLTESLLDEMDLQESLRIYRDRFADASDFTFVFVGSFELAGIRSLVETYLAGLPDLKRSETWKDVGIEKPEGVVKKTVIKGVEPKSQISIVFGGPFEWQRKNNYRLYSMASAFQIKLREVLREDKGGTYGVGVSASASKYPKEEYSINISFGCDPARVGELSDIVFQQIDSLRTFGLSEEYLKKTTEKQRRQYETDLKENRYWLGSLKHVLYYEREPASILEYPELVDSLTLDDLKNTAVKYFDLENYVQVVLLPERSEGSN
jgi:zinc protease